MLKECFLLRLYFQEAYHITKSLLLVVKKHNFLVANLWTEIWIDQTVTSVHAWPLHFDRQGALLSSPLAFCTPWLHHLVWKNIPLQSYNSSTIVFSCKHLSKKQNKIGEPVGRDKEKLEVAFNVESQEMRGEMLPRGIRKVTAFCEHRRCVAPGVFLTSMFFLFLYHAHSLGLYASNSITHLLLELQQVKMVKNDLFSHIHNGQREGLCSSSSFQWSNTSLLICLPSDEYDTNVLICVCMCVLGWGGVLKS